MTLRRSRRPTWITAAHERGPNVQPKSAVLIAFLLLNGLVVSEVQPFKVNVGDPMVNGSALQPYKNEWQVSVTSADGKEFPEAANWTDQLESVVVNGRRCLRRTQVATFKKKSGEVVGSTTNIDVFDAKTMAPVSRLFTRRAEKGNREETTRVEFREHSVHFEHAADGKTDSQDAKMEMPAFDFYGGLYGLLLSAFPLKTGFSATFPSVNEDDPSVSWVTFRVTGEEPVHAGRKGMVDTCVVEADTNQGPMKFWLSKNAPYIIRLEYRAKDNGLTWTYTMV